MEKILELSKKGREVFIKNNEKEGKIWKFIDVSVLLIIVLFLSNTFLMTQGAASFRVSGEVLRGLGKLGRMFGGGSDAMLFSFVGYVDGLRMVFIIAGILLLIDPVLKLQEKFKVDEKLRNLIYNGYFMAVVGYVVIAFLITLFSDLSLGLSTYVALAIAIFKTLKFFNIEAVNKVKIPFKIEFFDFYVIVILISVTLEMFIADIQFGYGMALAVGFDLLGFGFMLSGISLFVSFLTFAMAAAYLWLRAFPMKEKGWPLDFARVVLPSCVFALYIVNILLFLASMSDISSTGSITLTFWGILIASVYYSVVIGWKSISSKN